MPDLAPAWRIPTEDGWNPRVWVSRDGRIFVAYGNRDSQLAELARAGAGLRLVREATIVPAAYGGHWLTPGGLTVWRPRPDAGPDWWDRLELDVRGAWDLPAVAAGPSPLTGGNAVSGRDGHVAAQMGRRVTFEERVLTDTAGHPNAFSQYGAWVTAAADADHTAIVQWYGAVRAVHPVQTPLQQSATGPGGRVAYGGYGPIHGFVTPGVDVDLTVTQWRWEAAPYLWDGHDGATWLATIGYSPAHEADQQVLLRPWGARDAVSLPIAATTVSVAHAAGAWIVATSDDHGGARVDVVPFDTPRRAILLNAPPVIGLPPIVVVPPVVVLPPPVVDPPRPEAPPMPDLTRFTFADVAWTPDAGDPRRFPRTATLEAVTWNGADLRFTITPRPWPALPYPHSDDGTTIDGNLWLLIQRGGAWVAGVTEWLRPGQSAKGISWQDLGEFFPGSARDRWGMLAGWQPAAGEVLGLFATTPARSGFGATLVSARSTVVFLAVDPSGGRVVGVEPLGALPPIVIPPPVVAPPPVIVGPPMRPPAPPVLDGLLETLDALERLDAHTTQLAAALLEGLGRLQRLEAQIAADLEAVTATLARGYTGTARVLGQPLTFTLKPVAP